MKRLMTNRRNLITILLIVAVLFFLFMFSGTAKDILNRYGENSYASGSIRGRQEQTLMDAESGVAGESGADVKVSAGDEIETDDSGYVIFAGEDSNIIGVVQTWCSMHDRRIETHYNPMDIEIDEDHPPVMLIATAERMTAAEIHHIMECSGSGVPVVMATMPGYDIIEADDEIRHFLGIRELRAESTEMTGMSLYGGFLLGGSFDYEPIDEKQRRELMDLDLSMPWYTTLSGTKTYMAGILPDEVMDSLPEDVTGYKNMHLPAIVWRNMTENGPVFCVNANYMRDMTGFGLLSAMEYEVSDYVIYPVVNAQSTVIVNFPSMIRENTDVMESMYARDSLTVERDVIWPNLAASMERDDSKLTCMISPKLDYSVDENPNEDALVYFMKLFKEADAEAGICTDVLRGATSAEKLLEDHEVLSDMLPDYVIQTAYIGLDSIENSCTFLDEAGFDDVDTIICAPNIKKRMMGHTKDGRVYLRAINEGDSHTFTDDLRMRSIQTALAYSLVVEDLSHVIYPRDDSDEWQQVYDRYASYSTTFFSEFDQFEEVTASQAARRADAFMGIDYAYSKSGDIVKVSSNTTGAYYMLRTHGELVDSVIGGMAEQVDEDTYIIYVRNLSATVFMKEEDVSPIY